MNPRSVRFRLTAWYACILAATFAVAGMGVWLALRDSIHESADKELRSRLQAVRQFLGEARREGGAAELVEDLNEQTSPDGAQIRVADSSGKWIFASPGSDAWGLPTPLGGKLPERGMAGTVVVAGKHLRVLSAPAGGGIAQIGMPVEEFYDLLGDFTWTVALAAPLLLLLAFAGGYWMSGRALHPVGQIARMAQDISAQNLSHRLPLRGSGDELDQLSATLNEMFGRLEAAFSRITQFTADASHELRTPLAIMRTTAEVVGSKPRSEEEHAKAWDSILRESERTSRLIDDLLLLARADAGSDGLAFEPMDLAACLRDACREMRIMAEAAGLRFETCQPAECPISGDGEALRRLIFILVDNAIKYTPPGGEVRVKMEVAPGKAAIEVRDTGAGISPEDQFHIFDRFYRASKDRSRKTGGAGLGLSIAQWMAARHGGEILVESTPGVGSAFKVILPTRSSLFQNPPA